ncbi:MAG: class I SAM-dependent methyltransferase [Gammaproteobacteria bacterium]|nr:class I SAM-dependent methyltransferase [Gammaproteobacteria bacterium]
MNGIVHEVRSAGATRRLYTDGVFHSQYNPRHPVGGHLWDLLMLPAFFADTGKLRRILVLGSGGGAVMHQLNYFIPAETIIGIDNNPQHHYVARKYFGVIGSPFHLIEADAMEWIAQYDGLPFDLIIDDLYGECNGEPHRAIAPDTKWFSSMYQLLTPSGLLVMNFMSFMDLKLAAWWTSRRIRRLFPYGFRLSMDNYENNIGVFGRKELNRSAFTRRLLQYPELDRRRKTTRLRYRMSKLTHV